MINTIYEIDNKDLNILVTITNNYELIYLRTNIKSYKLIIENIRTKKRVYSGWIGFMAEYFITGNLITFLDYYGTIKIFDIEKRQIVKICKPNKKLEVINIAHSYINEGLIIYSSDSAYFVDVNKNEYINLDIVLEKKILFLVQALQKEKKLVFYYARGVMKVFDYELNLEYDSTKSDQSETSEYDYLRKHYKMLSFNEKYIMNYLEPVSCSYMFSKIGEIIKGIDDNNEELRSFHHFRKSVGNEKYYYGLTNPDRYIYIFDSVTDQQLRRLKATTYISDVLINDVIKVMVIVAEIKITAYQYDDILDFTNYNG